MTSADTKSIFRNIAKFVCMPAVAVALTGCGGGGGGDLEQQPAPQTLNATVLTLYSGGVAFTFIRDSGNAANGETERGSIIYTEDPGTGTTNSTPAELKPSDKAYNVTYTYTRDSAQSGTITITGTGSGEDSAAGTSNYFAGDGTDVVVRTYEVSFAASGNIVSIGTIFDYSSAAEGPVSPGFTWRAATLTLYPSGNVPLGFDIEDSNRQDLPTLYPDSVAGNNGAGDDPAKNIVFNPEGDKTTYIPTSSSYSPYTSDTDYTEAGLLDRVIDNPASTATGLNFEFTPNSGSFDTVTFTVKYPSGHPLAPAADEVYTLVFGDTASGTVTGNGVNTKFRLVDP